MRNVELQVPLRIYTRSGDLIAQIGEQRRIPVSYEQIPDVVKDAFLAAEDDRFFEHHGIDSSASCARPSSISSRATRRRAPAPSPCRRPATCS